MRLRTFTAADMPSAMKLVREALGDNAIILATEPHKGKGVSVTAAIDHKEDIPNHRPARQTSHSPDNAKTDELRHETQNILRFHNVPDLFISKIMHKASHKELASISALHYISANRDEKPLFRLALEKLLATYFQFSPLPFDSQNLRIMLVGPPGIGKTLTIAKMAAHLSMKQSGKLAVVTTDNKRAGGVEQLQAFTNILEIDLHVAPTSAKLGEYLRSLSPDTQLLVDTAGCNPYDDAELKELSALATIKGIEPILVLPAGGDSMEAIDIVETFTTMPIKKLLVTRVDTARRLGGILAAAAAHKLSFCNISGSSRIADALQPVNAALLAQLLLRYQLQSK